MPKRLKNQTGREYKKQFSGMKKAPESCLQVSRDATISKKKALTRIQMKKVRPHETLESWERRMRKYNLVSEEAIQRKLSVQKYKYQAQVKSKEVERKYRKRKNEIIYISFYEKQHDFLKYYGIVLNYYSVKYGIRKSDFEIGYAFYNNKLIDIDRFNNICILNTGNSSGIFARFKKNGYVSELINHKEFEKKDNQDVKTNTYKLSLPMTKLISSVYEKIAKLNILHKRHYKGMYSPECEKEIIAMNDEINDYLELNKKQLNISEIE